MKITNQKYPNLNLSNQDKRGDHLIIDFIISSLLTIPVILFTYHNISLSILLYFVIRFLYYLFLEYKYGRTLGKFQTQSKVVNKDGGAPSISQLVKRNLSRFISILSGITDDETALHDQFSNTFVVNDDTLKKIEFKQPLYLLFNLAIIGSFVYFLINSFITSTKTGQKIEIETVILAIVAVAITSAIIKQLFRLFKS